MPAAKLDLSIEQGADWRQHLTWKDADGQVVDLTHFHAHMQARSLLETSDTLLDLSDDENGGITLGGALGTIDIAVDAATSSAWQWRKAVYDLELTDGSGMVTRLIRGAILVDPEVTR